LVDAHKLQPDARINAKSLNLALHTATDVEGVVAVTRISLQRKYVAPLYFHNLITPAVTVPTALIEMSSIRDPADPAAITAVIVPVPSRLVLAVLMVTAAVLGVAAYAQAVAI
jgi:hypothetical protein